MSSPFAFVPALAGACAVLAVGTVSASAHHPGGVGNSGGAGPINTISASTLEQGQTVAGVVVDTTALNIVPDQKLIAATAAGNIGVHGLRRLEATALGAAYGVTSDLMISARLPYLRRTGIRAAEDDGSGTIGVLDHGGSTGVGDLTLLGQYRFLNDRANRFEAALLFGTTAPTGPTNRRSRQGELLDAEFQPGTGAWSGLAGLAVTKRWGSWSFDTNVLYVRATEGSQNTNLGNQFLYNAAVSYRLTGLAAGNPRGPMYHGGVSHSHEEPAAGPNLDLVMEANGEWHGKQKTLGVTDDNSGGNTVFLSPGVRLSQGKVSGFVSVGIPLALELNGIQPEPEWRIRSGIAVAF